MRKRGKKLLAVLLAASMTLGQGTTWTLAQEDVAEAIEGAAVSAQAEEDESESFGDESQDEPSGETGENPGEGEEGGSEGDGSSGDTSGSGDGSSEEGDQEDGDGGDNSEETGEENNSNGNGNPNGDLSGEPENPDGITDGEEDGTTETAETDFRYEDEKIIIDAKATEAAGFTKDTVLKADYLDPEGTEEQKAAYQNAVETIREQMGQTLTNNNEEATLDYVLYDVYFESPTGERLEPAEGTVEVTMSFKEPVDLETKDPETNEQNYELLNQEVVHIQQNENDTETAEIVENSDIKIENDKITSATFTQDSFSVMGLAWAKVAVQSADNGAEVTAVKLVTDEQNNDNVWGKGIITGSGEMDNTSWNGVIGEGCENAGYDSSTDNDIIRSFDSIKYSVSSTFNLSSDSHPTLIYEVTLPDDDELTLDEEKMNAKISCQKNEDGTKTYVCKYKLEDNAYTAGEKEEDIIVKVGNKKQGDTVQPTIKAYFEGDKESALTVTNMQQVKVTTAPMYNIVLVKKNNDTVSRATHKFGNPNPTKTDETIFDAPEGYNNEVEGYKYTFGIALEIRRPGKGIKGVEIPDATKDFTFQIDLSDVTLNGKNLAENGFTPLLYSWGANKSQGGETVADIPFTSPGENEKGVNSGCYNSGDIKISQNGTTLSVTVNNFKIKESEFPKANPRNTSYWEDANKIREGIFSAFKFQVVYPYINANNENLLDKLGTGTVTANVKVKNMSATSINNTAVNQETTEEDNAQSNTFNIVKGNTREQRVFYSSRKQITSPYSVGAIWTDEDIAAVGASDLAFSVSYLNNNLGTKSNNADMPVVIDQMVLFDRKAIKNVSFNKFYQRGGSGYSCSVFYAVLKENSRNNYNMRKATLEDFNFYTDASQLPADGCDAVLVRYQGVNIANEGVGNLELHAQFLATVNNDANQVADNVYMLTAFTNIWTASDFQTEIGTDLTGTKENLQNLVNTKVKPEVDKLNPAELVEKKKLTLPTIDHRDKYTIPQYENGTYTADSANVSINYADALYIVPYTTTVTKTVAQTDSNGDPIKVYNIGKGQNYVDYKISSSMKYLGNVTPEGTTTVYFEDTLPEGLTYVEGSARWGGTYIQRFPQAGKITNGQKIEPTVTTDTENEKTVVKLNWEIPNVKLVNGDIPEFLYYTCEIAKNISNNKTLDNKITIQTDEDHRAIYEENENLSTAGISVTKSKEFYIAKRGGDSLELQDDSYYELVAANTSSADRNNLWIFDTMPYANDGKSTQIKGKYEIISLTMNAKDVNHAADMDIWYTNEKKYIGKTADDINASEISEGNGWKKADAIGYEGDTITFSGEGLIGSWPTVIAYHDASLKSNTTATLRLDYKAVAGAEGDDFENAWSTMSNEQELIANAETEIYKRTLEGTVWLDKDKNGKIGKNEKKLEGIKVTLLIKNENDEYVPYTPYNETVDGKIQASEVTTYTDKDGHYKFTGLPAGEYRVKFESGNGVSLGGYDVTIPNADDDTTITSKVKKENANKNKKGELESGLITDITMPPLSSMNDKVYNLPDQNLGLIIPTSNVPSNPDPVKPSDPKPSVTLTPTAIPTPSATPTPSGTPTPSATPTPSETPKPSEAPKPSVTPPAEEIPTPAPAAGSITVTKNLKVNGTPVGAENQKFYVALFEDADCTQRASDVKTLAFQYASSATVTFDNLEPGKTYYVSETDENGEAILAGILDSGDIYTADFTNGNVVSVDSKNGSTIDFDNEFEDIPDGFYYAGNLKVTKTLLGSDGKAKNSDKTFYAGVFADADHTKLSGQVAKNIIPLSLNGASSVSAEVEVYMENADSVVKLYVTEVDKSGTPVEKDSSFAYSVTVKDGNATISKDALDARVVITNQEKNNSTPQGGGDTPSTQGGGSNPQSYSSGSSSVTPVKTGDSTPVMAMLLLLAASALVISTVMAKKKKSK